MENNKQNGDASKWSNTNPQQDEEREELEEGGNSAKQPPISSRLDSSRGRSKGDEDEVDGVTESTEDPLR